MSRSAGPTDGVRFGLPLTPRFRMWQIHYIFDDPSYLVQPRIPKPVAISGSRF